MTPDLLARYADRPLPRYTSYPTAPHFVPGIDPDEYADWLGCVPPEEVVSLYLHVPFCRSMCWYCGCHTTVTSRDEPMHRYMTSVEIEIEWAAHAIGHRQPVRHIHFGGGTPSLMGPVLFGKIMTHLQSHFRIGAATEVAIELDPRTLDISLIEALGSSGVTRASIGVQSFDPLVQKAVNRIQSFRQVAAATTGLRAAGVARVNFDLIYGLPHQTVRSCIDTVERALSLEPDRFAVFGYAHVPSFKLHQRKIEAASLPDGPERHAQAEAISQRLLQAGYIRIGLDHYARPGDELAEAALAGGLHRNFQGYTTDACETLIGFGASSIGRFAQGYVQNSFLIGEYQRRVDAQGTAAAKARAFAKEDRLRGAIIERIMCDYRVDLAELCARHGARAEELIGGAARLGELLDDQLIALEDNILTVREAARPLVRAIAAAFDQYIDAGPTRHSRSI